MDAVAFHLLGRFLGQTVALVGQAFTKTNQQILVLLPLAYARRLGLFDHLAFFASPGGKSQNGRGGGSSELLLGTLHPLFNGSLFFRCGHLFGSGLLHRRFFRNGFLGSHFFGDSLLGGHFFGRRLFSDSLLGCGFLGRGLLYRFFGGFCCFFGDFFLRCHELKKWFLGRKSPSTAGLLRPVGQNEARKSTKENPDFHKKIRFFLFILAPTISPVLELSRLAKHNYVTTLGQLDSFRPASAWPSTHGYVRLRNLRCPICHRDSHRIGGVHDGLLRYCHEQLSSRLTNSGHR